MSAFTLLVIHQDTFVRQDLISLGERFGVEPIECELDDLIDGVDVLADCMPDAALVSEATQFIGAVRQAVATLDGFGVPYGLIGRQLPRRMPIVRNAVGRVPFDYTGEQAQTLLERLYRKVRQAA